MAKNKKKMLKAALKEHMMKDEKMEGEPKHSMKEEMSETHKKDSFISKFKNLKK